MKLAVFRSLRSHPALRVGFGPIQSCSFGTDVASGDQKSKSIRYKYPPVYNPYGPRPPPSEKIIKLAELISGLPPEEREMIGPALVQKLSLPRMQHISGEGMEMGSQGNSGAASSDVVEKKAEKTVFDVKLEKYEDKVKLNVIKQLRTFTSLGLAEARDLVQKAPVIVKQGVTKEEANEIIEKLKAAGGVAVME